PAHSCDAADDDRADRTVGNDVSQGVSGDSAAPGKWQRAGIAGVSHLVEDVPANLEFVRTSVLTEARPHGRKDLQLAIRSWRRVCSSRGAGRIRRVVPKIPFRAHAADSQDDWIWLEIAEGAASGDSGRRHAPQVFSAALGDSQRNDGR